VATDACGEFLRETEDGMGELKGAVNAQDGGSAFRQKTERESYTGRLDGEHDIGRLVISSARSGRTVR
jgi:hypothetical protein